MLERVSNTTCIAPRQVNNVTASVALEAAFPDIGSFTPPLIDVFQQPGDDTKFYAMQKAGYIYRFDNTPSATGKDVFLDIDSQTISSGEMGLLGFAFHPQFQTNGYFYVYYNDSREPNARRSTVSRFTYTGTLPVDTSTELVLLTEDQPYDNHNGGNLVFGPDGYLYIGFGDGGTGTNSSQNPLNFLGSFLRIDVDRTADGKNYAIPTDNPFVGNAGYLPETYAYGFRNPWRWSFHPQTNELWVADVGYNSYEEIDIVVAGGNYGWPIMEGTHCASDGCDSSGLELPIVDFAHPGSCSITGGHFYFGDAIPSLRGSYIFADYCQNRFSRLWRENDAWQVENLSTTGFGIPTIGIDNQGELYTVNMWGGSGRNIYKLIETDGGATNIPGTISESGCFSSVIDKTYADGVVPYEGSSKLWSDGADKTRYFAIPDGETIDVLADGDFDFPIGSVLIKHFFDQTTWLETRLFMRHEIGWAGYSYEWNDAQTEANLLSSGKTKDTGSFIHTYPSPGECLQCHTGVAGGSLGVEAGQLDWDLTYPESGLTANQVTAIHAAGFLNAEPTAIQKPYLPGLDDASASIQERARSYLHSNCSGCHREGGLASFVNLKIDATLSGAGCESNPVAGDLGVTGAKVIDPGNPDNSVLLLRMKNLGEYRMPPLGTLIEDTAATGLISQWISSLAGCD